MSRSIRRAALTCAAISLMAAPSAAQELRIGYLNTTSGGGAVLGRHLANGWKLGLEHQGWKKDGDKLGGVPTRIFYADDRMRPEVALTAVKRFLRRDRVDIVAGIIWTNVMMTIHRTVFKAGKMLLSTNSGPAALAGKGCSPLFVSSSFYNDGNSEAIGEIANKDGIKSVVLMAPNYQGGRDMLAGFVRTFKGKVADQIYFKLGTGDFQAHLSKLRAAKPEALAIFAPGAMGIAFMKQWTSYGLGKQIKLYSINTIDNMSLPAIGAAALGAVEAQHWNQDLDNPKNKRFVKDYVARFGHLPSHLAVAAYDAPGLIARGMRAVGGKTDDMAAVARAIRKGTIDSPRGTLTFNVNGFVIQPYWKVKVVPGANGKPVIRALENLGTRKDPYWPQCPKDKRV